MINLYDHSLQPSGLETPLQIHFWKCLVRKECYKILKISKRSLCKTTPLFHVASLRFRISSFNKIRLKDVSCYCSLKWLQIYQKKAMLFTSNSIAMLNLHASEKNRFIHFPEEVQKSCCSESFSEILEKRLY